jgi:hypothetical protein
MFFANRVKTARGEKAREAPSVERGQAGICVLFMFQIPNQTAFS